jgi:thiamine biosynthesis lipoprotein
MSVPFRHRFNAMTTQCELQFYGVDQGVGSLVAGRIHARVAELVLRYNFHSPGSWLNQAINRRQGIDVELDEECAEILATVRQHAERLHGIFDITVGTYAQQLKHVASIAEADAVRKRLAPYTGLSVWALEGSRLRFDNPHTRFDLGGVIKEYAVDEAARIARTAGIRSGLINFGGDLATFGLKPDGKRFVVAIPNPATPENLLFGLDLEDQALTTSAHYARRRQLRGGTLSHVVTANPDQADWVSASVVSRSALVSGIYSTALLISRDIALPPDTYAVAVDRASRLHRLPVLAA